MLKHVLICHIFVIVQIIYLTASETPKNYGEFKLKIFKFEMCKGPKRRDCINVTASVQNETNLLLNYIMEKEVVINRGKIVSMMNNKLLVRLQMKNPCDHLFMKPLFQAIFNVSKNCEFKKGLRTINVDINDIAQKYYGGMFLYGNLTFKSVFYNDECNFSCSVAEVNFSPKKKARRH